MQLSLQFNDACEPIILSQKEQIEKLEELATKIGIKALLRLNKIKMRPRQFVLMEELCKRQNENLLIEAGTGLGKTLIYIFRALQYISKGQKSILITTEDKLVRQCEKKLLEQTQLNKAEILGLSGKISPDKRRELILNNPKTIITTPGVMIQDFEHYDWENIGFIMFDETQTIVKDSSAMELAKMIKEIRKSKNLKHNVCGMSATLASNKNNLTLLKDVLEARTILTVLNPIDSVSSIDDVVKKIPVDLDKLTRKILNHLKLLVCGLISEIEKETKIPMLFDIPNEMGFSLPFFVDREKIRTRLNNPNFRHPKIGQLRAKLSELEFYCDLHFRLLSMGVFAFLEKYCYARCQWLFAKDARRIRLHLPEMSSKKICLKPDASGNVPAVIGRGKINALSNSTLHELVIQCAERTPYLVILKSSTWLELREKILNTDLNEDLSEFSTNAQRRLKITAIRNQSLLHRSKSKKSATTPEIAEETALVRSFFNYAMGYMCKREMNDHEKYPAMLDRLNEVRQLIPNVSSFIFTPLTRHAEFLAERLEISCYTNSIRPVAAHGGLGPGMDEFRKSALNGFNERQFNIMVTTVPFAGTGIDVENATIGIHYALSTSNHIQLVQANGRVLGRADIPILSILWSNGSEEIELKRFLSAVNKERTRRNEVIKQSYVLEPNFDIELA